jgi:hypothetical protein
LETCGQPARWQRRVFVPLAAEQAMLERGRSSARAGGRPSDRERRAMAGAARRSFDLATGTWRQASPSRWPSSISGRVIVSSTHVGLRSCAKQQGNVGAEKPALDGAFR